MKQKHKQLLVGYCMGVILVCFLFALHTHYTDSKIDYSLKEKNYKPLVLLGLSPNAEMREPTASDIETDVLLKDSQGNIYRLYESRDPGHFKDYGKTFIWRVA